MDFESPAAAKRGSSVTAAEAIRPVSAGTGLRGLAERQTGHTWAVASAARGAFADHRDFSAASSLSSGEPRAAGGFHYQCKKSFTPGESAHTCPLGGAMVSPEHLCCNLHTRTEAFYGCSLTFVRGGVNLLQHMFLNMSCFICLGSDTLGIMSVHLGNDPHAAPPAPHIRTSPPQVLVCLCWRDDLVNAALLLLTDRHTCSSRGGPPHSEKTNRAANSPRRQTALL